MRDLYGLVIYLESILNQGIILIECVRVLLGQRAQHEIGSLSTHRGEIFPYPDIKKLVEIHTDFLVESYETHRDFSSRFSQENLVETLIIIHHLIYYYVYQNQSRLSTRIQSRYVIILTHGLHLVEICAIICTYTSRLLHGHYAQEMLHGHARHRVLGRLAHTQSGLGKGDLPLPRRIYPFQHM